MKSFWRENWMYVAVPAAVIVGVVLWLLLSKGAADSGSYYPL